MGIKVETLCHSRKQTQVWHTPTAFITEARESCANDILFQLNAALKNTCDISQAQRPQQSHQNSTVLDQAVFPAHHHTLTLQYIYGKN